MNTQTYSNSIIKTTELLKNADYILIGAGAGLSASGGLDYTDPVLFEKWFPELKKRGISTIMGAISTYWSADDNNRTSFWAYWATHIQKIRYDSAAADVYLDLLELVEDKKHFVITTNADGQFTKAGFNRKFIYAPQGDYRLFQCKRPCSNAVYDNQEMIQAMISNMDRVNFQVRKSDIPHCPICGADLERNLRADDTFVEAPHMVKRKAYMDFLNASMSGNLVLLELGVGFNTPVIIRWPFEEIAVKHPNATLIRMNKHHPEVSKKAETRTISLNTDIAMTLQDILNECSTSMRTV